MLPVLNVDIGIKSTRTSKNSWYWACIYDNNTANNQYLNRDYWFSGLIYYKH